MTTRRVAEVPQTCSRVAASLPAPPKLLCSTAASSCRAKTLRQHHQAGPCGSRSSALHTTSSDRIKLELPPPQVAPLKPTSRPQELKLVVFVPAENVDAVLTAMHNAGAGVRPAVKCIQVHVGVHCGRCITCLVLCIPRGLRSTRLGKLVAACFSLAGRGSVLLQLRAQNRPSL